MTREEAIETIKKVLPMSKTLEDAFYTLHPELCENDAVEYIKNDLIEQLEVNFEDIEFLLDKVKYMSGLWVKTNPNCTKIINAFNNRLNVRKEENK